jgi:hypothetical protein
MRPFFLVVLNILSFVINTQGQDELPFTPPIFDSEGNEYGVANKTGMHPMLDPVGLISTGIDIYNAIIGASSKKPANPAKSCTFELQKRSDVCVYNKRENYMYWDKRYSHWAARQNDYANTISETEVYTITNDHRQFNYEFKKLENLNLGRWYEFYYNSNDCVQSTQIACGYGATGKPNNNGIYIHAQTLADWYDRTGKKWLWCGYGNQGVRTVEKYWTSVYIENAAFGCGSDKGCVYNNLRMQQWSSIGDFDCLWGFGGSVLMECKTPC